MGISLRFMWYNSVGGGGRKEGGNGNVLEFWIFQGVHSGTCNTTKSVPHNT